MGKALFDKIWDSHVITDLGNGFILMHIDRLLLHDMSGGKSMKEAIEKGYTPAQPRLIYATPDHTMSTKPGRTEKTHPPGEPLILSMRETTSQFGIKLFDLGQDGNGIVHVVGPEQGLTLPGTTLVCGDSHTCDARRHGRAGLRHRRLGAGACDRHANHGAEEAQALPRQLRGQAAARRHLEGHDPPPDRRRRHRRRNRLCRRICGRRRSAPCRSRRG